jgi:glycosyltransferase involved in cell wall biosynthesis
MRCPTLNELPPPPAGRKGWPWTKESPPPACLDAGARPRITIVSASFSQGAFIEETIRSILLQGYPDLEYIIFDGGSKDESIEIIHKYERWISYWVSEPDRGQSDAINKGFKRATGEIQTWLNCDDTYVPGALYAAANYFRDHSRAGFVYGDCEWFDETGRTTRLFKGRPYTLESALASSYICQPASFVRRSLIEKVGLLDESLHYVMDTEWWFRMACHDEQALQYLPIVLARYRRWSGAKTMRVNRAAYCQEAIGVYEKAIDALPQDHPVKGKRFSLLLYQHLDLLRAHFAAGNLVEGRACFEKATRNSRSPAEVQRVFDALVWGLAQPGAQFKRAQEELNRCYNVADCLQVAGADGQPSLRTCELKLAALCRANGVPNAPGWIHPLYAILRLLSSEPRWCRAHSGSVLNALAGNSAGWAMRRGHRSLLRMVASRRALWGRPW